MSFVPSPPCCPARPVANPMAAPLVGPSKDAGPSSPETPPYLPPPDQKVKLDWTPFRSCMWPNGKNQSLGKIAVRTHSPDGPSGGLHNKIDPTADVLFRFQGRLHPCRHTKTSRIFRPPCAHTCRFTRRKSTSLPSITPGSATPGGLTRRSMRVASPGRP